MNIQNIMHSCSSELSSSSSGGDAKKVSHASKSASEPKLCEALGCSVNLRKTGRAYCVKRGLCPVHLKADSLLRIGAGTQLWRFCQQCGKLEALDKFESAKRSCRLGLSKRRRSSHTDTEASMSTSHDDSTNSTSSKSCNSLSRHVTSPALDAEPEQLAYLESQLHTLQSMLVKLGHEADFVAAQANASWRSMDTGSYSGISTQTLMPAAACGQNRNAAVTGSQCHNSFISSPGSFTSCPPASSAPAAVIAPASIQDWMQLAESDEAHFAAWLEQQLQRDVASAAALNAAGQQLALVHQEMLQMNNQTEVETINPLQMPATLHVPHATDDINIEQELWELCRNW